ncbi:hypothetical protein C8Q80DRAFT_1264322 [Daedaleopsis nitida]|nr:hypothetical protein C8Q80DRAFT_1264322 [Daedaleopsis nitida]
MTRTDKIVLYGAPTSPYFWRVLLALDEAHAEYEKVVFSLAEKPLWYTENINPWTGKVPALVYGGRGDAPVEKPSSDAVRIIESPVILEFIADLYPDANLLPKDPAKRAAARQFVSILDQGVVSDTTSWITNQDDGTKHLQLLETLQGLLPAEGFILGKWSIADAAFISIFAFSHVFVKSGVGYGTVIDTHKVEVELASPRFARLQQYLEDWKARSSYQTIWDENELIRTWRKRWGFSETA